MAFTKINAAGIGTTETVTVDGLTVINDGSFGGNLSVGGTITYEDVTNVDSVGIITARAGVLVGSGITLSKDGDGFFTGIVTATSFSGSGANLTGIDTDLVSDTSPQLGGNLDVNSKAINFGDSNGSTTNLVQFGAGTDLRIYHEDGVGNVINSYSSNDFKIFANGNTEILTNNAEVCAKFIKNGSVELYEDNTKVAETTAGGWNVEGVTYSNGLDMDDSHKILLGTDDDLEIFHNGSNAYIKNGTGQQLYRSATHTFENAAGSSEYLRITSSGDMGLGTSSPVNFFELKNATAQKRLVLSKSDSGSADENGMWLQFNNYGPSATARAADTIIGKLHFYASQPTSGNLQDAGAIECRADGSQTGNVTKSYLSFLTTSTNTATERLRISSTGKATFTSTVANQRGVSIVAPESQLNFGPNLDKGGFLMSENNGQFGLSGGAYWNGSAWVATHTGAGIIRQDGDGVIHFLGDTGLTDGNTFTPTETLTLTADGIITCRGRTGRAGKNGTTAGNVINFMWTVSATLQAWVDTTNIGNLTYSSDYRIKKNITTMSDGAIDRIKLLRPVTYQPDDFTLNGTVVSAASDTVKEGFIAHEVGEIISSGCEGEKDAENQIQTLQLDAIVSVSTKALQELIAKVETLEAKVAALEGS